MTMRLSALVLAALVAVPAGAAFAQDGDAQRGETVFRKCMACHRVGDNARNLVGPVLNGVVGRTAGTGEGYNYSAINHAAGEAGLKWTPENIIAYLPDPNAFLKNYLTQNGKADQAKGSTKMTFRLADEQERRDVVAYLRTFSNTN